jgi:hypothetical protein
MMDIEHVNRALNKAILSFQGAEVQVMAEAMASGSTSYKVPSPAAMGFTPKAKGKKASSGQWKRKKFEVVLPPKVPWEEETEETIQAVVRGPWAVHKSLFGGRRGFVVTHAPSGQMVTFPGYSGTFYDTQKQAKLAVDRWIEAFPELLNPGRNVKALFQKYHKDMKEISRKVVDPSGRSVESNEVWRV